MWSASRRGAKAPHEPRHRATVDGFVAKFSDDDAEHAEALVEFKTHGIDVRPAWTTTRPRCRAAAYVTGFDRAVLAVATVDDSEDRIVGFRVSIIEADPLIQDGLVILARILDDHLADGTLPDPDGSPVQPRRSRPSRTPPTPPTPSLRRPHRHHRPHRPLRRGQGRRGRGMKKEQTEPREPAA